MWSRPWWQGGWVAGCSVVVRVVVLVVADPPQVEEGDAHALGVGSHVVLDAVLLEERAHALGHLRVVVLRHAREEVELSATAVQGCMRRD